MGVCRSCSGVLPHVRHREDQLGPYLRLRPENRDALGLCVKFAEGNADLRLVSRAGNLPGLAAPDLS